MKCITVKLRLRYSPLPACHGSAAFRGKSRACGDSLMKNAVLRVAGAVLPASQERSDLAFAAAKAIRAMAVLQVAAS
jgi:hypothetical protein